MKTLTFDLIQWHTALKEMPRNFTSLQVRNYKKQYFIGNAFNTAFPMSNWELPQRWSLTGTVEVEGGEEFDFAWKPDGTLTFTDLIKNSGEQWAKSMSEVADGEFAVAIKCVAVVK